MFLRVRCLLSAKLMRGWLTCSGAADADESPNQTWVMRLQWCLPVEIFGSELYPTPESRSAESKLRFECISGRNELFRVKSLRSKRTKVQAYTCPKVLLSLSPKLQKERTVLYKILVGPKTIRVPKFSFGDASGTG